MSFSYIVFVVAFIDRMHHKEPVNYLTQTKNFRFITIIPNWIFTINARKKCRFEIIKKRTLVEYELCVSTRDERAYECFVYTCTWSIKWAAKYILSINHNLNDVLFPGFHLWLLLFFISKFNDRNRFRRANVKIYSHKST